VQRNFVALSVALLMTACNNSGGGGGVGAAKPLNTEDDKTLYALGTQIGRSLNAFNLKPEELQLVQQGMADQIRGEKPKVEMEQYMGKVQELHRNRVKAQSEVEKTKGTEFLTKAAAEAGAVKSESGLVYKEITAGAGAQPVASDRVKVHYKGTLTNGEEFDSSYSRNQPAEFPLGGVIPCWTEGVQKMKVGGKAKLVCPSGIAYGDQGRPPKIPGGATLVFEVELIEIMPPAAPPPTAPPPTAAKK
jgi:FKBP-type peptidyl-prolyl cis-trans isomerase FkpA